MRGGGNVKESDYFKDVYDNLSPKAKAALSKGNTAAGSLSVRAFSKRLQEGQRWLELVESIGWAIAVFGDCLKVTLFTETRKDEWRKFCRDLIKRRVWVREQVREILGFDYAWMLGCPNCI
jgi:hypothetical protein